jgi:hypothetical protein
MKRDMDLIRKLILLVEDSPGGYAPNEIAVDGYSDAQIGYHSYLIGDAGLAVVADMTAGGDSGPDCQLIHLTSAGHDFADNARTPFIWDEALEQMKRKGVKSVSLDIFKKMLDRAIRKRLKDPES